MEEDKKLRCPICNQVFENKEILLHIESSHKQELSEILENDIEKYGEIKLSLYGSIAEFLNQLDVRIKKEREKANEINCPI